MMIYVRPSGSSLSRAVNLHLSRSVSSQNTIREHSYRVIQYSVCHLNSLRTNSELENSLKMIIETIETRWKNGSQLYYIFRQSNALFKYLKIEGIV